MLGWVDICQLLFYLLLLEWVNLFKRFDKFILFNAHHIKQNFVNETEIYSQVTIYFDQSIDHGSHVDIK